MPAPSAPAASRASSSIAVAALARAELIACAWTQTCANSHCTSGWLHPWRSRHAPRFEGAWACSAACTDVLVATAARRELRGRDEVQGAHAARMPLGLILLARGWISRQELEQALALQRATGRGRIGYWLRQVAGISEEMVARALAAQWNCIALTGGSSEMAPAPELIPAQIRESCGLLPLRHARRRTLYVAGEQRVEHSAIAAIERMLGLPIEPVFVEDSRWPSSARERPGLAEMRTPAGDQTVIELMTEIVEQERPQDSCLVRVKDFFWLRIWRDSRRPLRSSQIDAGGVRDFLVPAIRHVRIL
jgi:hypothetical protein